MTSLVLGFLAVALVVGCFVHALRLRRRIEKFVAAAPRSGSFDAGGSGDTRGASSEVSQSSETSEFDDREEWEHEGRLLRDLVRLGPGATARASFLGGAALGFISWAGALASTPKESVVPGVFCFALGGAGAIFCGAWGRKSRDLFRRADDRIPRIRRGGSAR